MGKQKLLVRPTLRFMLLRPIVWPLCWLQFMVFVATSDSLVAKEANSHGDAASSIVSLVTSPMANNSSPGDESSPGKDLVESIIDDDGLSKADKNLIGSIVAYAVAFGAMLILFCCLVLLFILFLLTSLYL